MAAAPTSNTTTCEGRHCLRIHEASSFFFFFFRLVRNWTNSCWFGWIQNHRFWLKPPIHVEIRKKKKGCKMHHFGWNNKTLTNLTRFILLIFSSLSLVSVLSVSALRLPSLTLNHSVTHTISLSTHSHTHTISLTTSPTNSQSQVLNSSLNSQAWPTLKSLNSGIKLKLSILVFQFF